MKALQMNVISLTEGTKRSYQENKLTRHIFYTYHVYNVAITSNVFFSVILIFYMSI